MINTLPVEVRMAGGGERGWLQACVEVFGLVRSGMNNPGFTLDQQLSFMPYLHRTDVELMHGAQTLVSFDPYVAYYLVDSRLVIFEVIPSGSSNLPRIFPALVEDGNPVNYWIEVGYNPRALQRGEAGLLHRASGQDGVPTPALSQSVAHILRIVESA